ncbi:MAG TPA: hypothetical protein VFF76_01405 [Holophagaceae bacterium]|nr:hypothetical protein [Holophagaceae bacterium]
MNLALFAGLHLLRDAPAVLDTALAARLALPVEQLRDEVAKDSDCFPEELVFHLTDDERKQVSSSALLAFTESGAALLTQKLPGAPVLEVLKELSAARGAWLDQAKLAQRVTALEQELKTIGDLIAAANKEAEAAKPEHPIGFVPEDLPHGLKAKDRAERDKS